MVIGTTFDHFSQKNAFFNFIFIKIFIKIRLKKKGRSLSEKYFVHPFNALLVEEDRRERREEEEFVVYVVMLRPSASRQDSRKKSFKKSADAEESRRKREDQMIAIRKEKREEAMAKKRINVGGGGHARGDEQIHPNVFDTSDSTAMTHEQRTHAKVRRRRPQFLSSLNQEGNDFKQSEKGGREICFFFTSVPFVPVSQREKGDLLSARGGATNTICRRRIFSFLFETTFLFSRDNSTTY